MANMNADTSAEALAKVLAYHAAARWGAPRAEDLQDRLVQTAQSILDVRQVLPGPDTEPGSYPAAEPIEAAGQQ